MRNEEATRVALVGTLVAVLVAAGISAGLAKPRLHGDPLSLHVSPTFDRDGGALFAGRF